MSFRIRSVLLLLTLCAGSPAAFAQSSCPTSVSSLNGWYGMVVSAYTLGANSGPRYLTGALLFNGTGGISGTHVYAGTSAGASAVTGTYVANSDCSLTLTLTIGGGTPQVYAVGINSAKEAVGVETDGNAVATIDLVPQYATVTTALNFTSSSLNGTFATSCYGPQVQASDTNLVTFSNGSLSGTDPYNNAGVFVEANVPYTGTYSVNSDGTFAGGLTVAGGAFDFYGVIANAGKSISYIYSNVVNSAPTGGFSACSGGLALESAAVASGSVTHVNLAASENVYGIAANGSAPVSGGLDGAGYAYSATLLGTSLTWAGESYVLGTSGTPSGVAGATIALPAGNFTNLSFLGTGVFGAQVSQSFVVTYTDGTSTTFTQSLSDWGAPQNYTGESIAAPMAYRVTASAGTQTNTANWNLYGYAFALNNAKTVKSLTLPGQRDVIILAANLLGVASTAPTLTAQSITFPAIAAQKTGTNVALAATATSGLTVSYASTTTSVCSVSGSTATLLTGGTCSITASQAGNSTYAAATPVSQSFTVAGTSSFTLAASPTSVSVTSPICFFTFCFGGSSGSTTITVAPVNGFSSAVTFTVGGLPSWITGTFSPASITGSGSTKLTLAPNTSSSLHTSGTPITITGKSGALTITSTVTLYY